MRRSCNWKLFHQQDGTIRVVAVGALDEEAFGAINRVGDLCLMTPSGRGVQITADDLRVLAQTLDTQYIKWKHREE